MLTCAVVLGAKLLIPGLGVRSPFVLFAASVMLAAWRGGQGPGLLATALSAPLIYYFFVPPPRSLATEHGAAAAAALVAYLVEGVLISLLCGALHRARRRAAAAAAVARDAVRSRDEFIAMASHELKTPLTTLRLNAESARRHAEEAGEAGVGGAWAASKFAAIVRQCDRVNRLLGDLLDASRIASGRLEVVRERVDLAEVAREVVARFQLEAERAGSRLSIVADAPVVGLWDRARVEQVATNLVTNAIKYGAARPIDVAVLADGDVARLEVRDEGIGVAPEHQARIFERFERATPSGRTGSFGLGLWIVRQLVTSMGGTIRVTSAVGAGSTFTVVLPLLAASTAAPAPRAEAPKDDVARAKPPGEARAHS